jgi:hypothetical protein
VTARDALEPYDFLYEEIKDYFAEQYPSATFSEAQWQEIKKSLAARDIDLNTQMVEEDGREEWWVGKDYTPAQRPLRNVLQEKAYYAAMAGGIKLQTPLQEAKKLQKTLTAFQIAITALASTGSDGDLSGGNLGVPTFDLFHVLIQHKKTLLVAMGEYAALLEVEIAMLKAMGSYKELNAISRKPHNQYWEVLALLWLKIAGSVGPKRRQHLCRFLVSCTPPPLFPAMAAQELEHSAAAFADYFFRFR